MTNRQFKRQHRPILEPDVPAMGDFKKAVMVKYDGHVLVVPYERWINGSYRLDFLKKFGVCLPIGPPPSEIKEYFCPNIEEITEIEI